MVKTHSARASLTPISCHQRTMGRSQTFDLFTKDCRERNSGYPSSWMKRTGPTSVSSLSSSRTQISPPPSLAPSIAVSILLLCFLADAGFLSACDGLSSGADVVVQSVHK
eukprot:766918-Hanusia_phi.AAC.1